MLKDPRRNDGSPVDIGHHRRRLLAESYRLSATALMTVYVGVALLGALAGNPVMVLFSVPLTGALGAVLAQGVHRALHPGVETNLVVHLPVAVGTGLFIPFIAGMESLGDDGAYFSVLVVLLAAVVGVGWMDGLQRQVRPHQPDDPPSMSEDERSSLRALHRALPLEELLREWHWSRERLHADRHAAVQLRELILEEMQRRDPMGFQRWLFTGLQEAPERHIGNAGSGGVAKGGRDEPPW